MKTLEEIKNEIAIERAYDSWNELAFWNNRNIVYIELIMDEVAKRYAKEVAIASLEKASENAKLKTFSTKNLTDFSKKMVDKSSIINEKNIVL